MSFCPKCGLKLNEEDIYCPKCGNKVYTSKENPDNENNKPCVNELDKNSTITSTIQNAVVDIPSTLRSTSFIKKNSTKRILMALGISALFIFGYLLSSNGGNNTNKVATVSNSSNNTANNSVATSDSITNTKTNNDSDLKAQSTTNSVQAKITGTEVRMRESPSTNSDILGYFELNEDVQVIEEQSNWRKVRRNNGSIGWVSSDYCKKNNELSIQENSNVAAINANCVWLRESPSMHTTLLARLNKGDKVEIIEKAKEWRKIKLTNGSVGWVPKITCLLPSELPKNAYARYRMSIEEKHYEIAEDSIHIEGFTLGMSRKKIEILYGKPISIKKKDPYSGHVQCSYNDMYIEYIGPDGQYGISHLEIFGSNTKRTKDGLGIGDDEEDIIRIYGYLDGHEYPPNGDNKRTYYYQNGAYSLFFEVENKKITKIGIVANAC